VLKKSLTQNCHQSRANLNQNWLVFYLKEFVMAVNQAVNQVVKSAEAEKFYIHLFGSRLNGGLSSISAYLKDPDILEYVLDQLVIEGKDYSDANSLFSGGKSNEDATQALQDAYDFSVLPNPDIDGRPAKKLFHSKAEKMQSFFSSLFNNPLLVPELDNDNGLDDFYSNQFYNNPSYPTVNIQPPQATQATQVGQSGAAGGLDLSKPPPYPVYKAKLTMSDRTQRVEGIAYGTAGKFLMATGASLLLWGGTALTGGTLAPVAATLTAAAWNGTLLCTAAASATTIINATANAVQDTMDLLDPKGARKREVQARMDAQTEKTYDEAWRNYTRGPEVYERWVQAR